MAGSAGAPIDSAADAPPPPRRAAPLGHLAWIVLLTGLAVRELLAPFTGHPYDLESFVRTGYAVAHGSSPYVASAPAVPGASFAYLSDRIALTSYPPAWPEFTGFAYLLWSAISGGNRFALYALLKQPGIVADLVVAIQLRSLALRWGAAPRTAFALLVGWSFFPYAIAITAIWGQFDSILAAIVLAALGARGPARRATLFGLGVLVKWLTIVLLPLELARSRLRTWPTVLVAFAALPLLGVLPFVLQGWSFPEFSTVVRFVAHGDNQGMNYVYLLGYGPWASDLARVPQLFSALGYLWIPVAVAAGMYAARWTRAERPVGALRAVLFVLLAVLTVRWGLYEQYFLAPFALLALDVAVFHPRRRALALLLLGVASAQLLVNNDLGLRFVTPLAPGYLATLQGLEASGPLASLRFGALALLSVAMTVTLLQWLWTLARDRPEPVPWPRLFLRKMSPWFPSRRRRPGGA